ncbi:MAG: hypothetical protein HYW27_01880 [Candidatus Aenigmarchaeota archaeon]|nr:hypothetical protein [Candidatus Aenigmarchaeota archaeon]
MEIKIIENENGKLKAEINDNSTLVNAINEKILTQRGADVSAFTTGHPYLGKPVLMVRGKDPEKAVIAAAEELIEDAKALKKQLGKQ